MVFKDPYSSVREMAITDRVMSFGWL